MPVAQQIPSTGLPHTRSGLRHWLATAVALAAVIGGVLALAPANGVTPVADSTTPSGVPHALPALAAPNPAHAALPLDCAGLPDKISQSFAADLRGDGTAATVVAAHCQSPAGTPPDGVYILQRGPGGTARVVFTLVRPTEDLTVLSLTLRSDGTIQAEAEGYSSTSVPRCCPDLREILTWTPHAGAYTRSVALPGATV